MRIGQEKALNVLVLSHIGGLCVKIYQESMILARMGRQNVGIQVIAAFSHGRLQFYARPNRDSNGLAHPSQG